MKNLKTLLLAAVLTLGCAFPTAVSASNSRVGEKTLGLSGGYAGYNNSGYVNVFFQYTFLPYMRVAPDVTYVFRHNDKSALAISCDLQFPIRLARAFNFYPIAGITFNSWNFEHDNNRNRVGADLGAGVEMYLTNSLKFNVQAKYSLMAHTSGVFVGLGIGYIF